MNRLGMNKFRKWLSDCQEFGDEPTLEEVINRYDAEGLSSSKAIQAAWFKLDAAFEVLRNEMFELDSVLLREL